MADTVYVGVDNGATGAIGVIGIGPKPFMFLPPVKNEQDYTKKAQNITRIDWEAYRKLLSEMVVMPTMLKYGSEASIKAFIERPFVNPGAFRTTVCAVRAFEATIIVMEHLGIPWQPIDSRAWQSKLLPEGLKGAPKLKKASRDIGIRMFPHLEDQIKAQKDADGLLIAEWARRSNL